MPIKVFFNDSCKVCRLEINHYKKISNSDLEWVDITNNKEAQLITSKTPSELLRRLHVIEDGKVISGASAFLVVWYKIPRYNIIYKKYRDKGIDMIAINSNQGTRNSVDSMSDMKKHAKKAKYEFSYTLDKESKLASAFGATKTPHVYLFNSEGKLVYRGAIDDNSRNPKKVEDNYLMDALDSMIEGKNISKVSTKALGCTIKFADN